VISLNPENAYSYYFKAVSEDLLHHYTEAVLDFNEAIKLNPRYADAYNSRGETKYHLNDVANACSDWIKANELGYISALDNIKKYCK
jgi:tetratricopeptide (TPR) repeat protein